MAGVVLTATTLPATLMEGTVMACATITVLLLTSGMAIVTITATLSSATSTMETAITAMTIALEPGLAMAIAMLTAM
jgi:hypothetical protein